MAKQAQVMKYNWKEVPTEQCSQQGRYWLVVVLHELACFVITYYNLNARKFELFDYFEILKYFVVQHSIIVCILNTIMYVVKHAYKACGML